MEVIPVKSITFKSLFLIAMLGISNAQAWSLPTIKKYCCDYITSSIRHLQKTPTSTKLFITGSSMIVAGLGYLLYKQYAAYSMKSDSAYINNADTLLLYLLDNLADFPSRQTLVCKLLANHALALQDVAWLIYLSDAKAVSKLFTLDQPVIEEKICPIIKHSNKKKLATFLDHIDHGINRFKLELYLEHHTAKELSQQFKQCSIEEIINNIDTYFLSAISTSK